MYGEPGVLASGGGEVQCHICGRWFTFLALHVRQAHDLMADEYRAQFGLMRSTALMGDGMRQRRRQKLEAQVQSGNLSRARAIEIISGATSEQRKEWQTGQRKTQEERKDPRFVERQRVAGEAIGQIRRRRAQRLEKTCPICECTFSTLACVNKQTCSKPCGEENRRRIQRERLSGPEGDIIREARTPDSFRQGASKRRRNL